MTKKNSPSRRTRSSRRTRRTEPANTVENQGNTVVEPDTRSSRTATDTAVGLDISSTGDYSQGNTEGISLSEATGTNTAFATGGFTNLNTVQIIGTTSMATSSTNQGASAIGGTGNANTPNVAATTVTMVANTNPTAPSDTDIIDFHKLLGVTVVNVTDAERATFTGFHGAIKKLAEVNGIDAYVTSTASRGVFNTKFNFVLPEGMKGLLNTKNAALIGVDDPAYKVPDIVLAQIYDLNKEALKETSDPKAGALLRMEIIKAGWHLEVKEVTFVKECMIRDFIVDNTWITENSERFKASAFYVPMAMELVFRTTGHHYLTADSANYKAKYNQIFRASLAPAVSEIMAAEDLYHTVTHPIELKFIYSVLRDTTASARLPNALVTRANSAPSGTAIVTTSAAVLQCLEAGPYYEEIIAVIGNKVEKVIELSETIKDDPAKYHVAFFAYGSVGLTQYEKKEFEDVKAIAITCAPVLQGFLDAMPKTAALAKARALSKHADTNPVLRNNVKVFFKAASKVRGSTLSEVMTMNVPVKPAVATGDDMDDEE